MLGNFVADPDGIEGHEAKIDGLGLLDISTTIGVSKSLEKVSGFDALTQSPTSGFEMHMGKTTGPDTDQPWLILGNDRPDGARSKDGLILGSYVHGLFAGDAFRTSFLRDFRSGAAQSVAYDLQIEQTLDLLADHLNKHLTLYPLFGA